MQYIYLIKNNITKRVYVGRSKSPQMRFKLHMNALKRNRHPVEIMQNDFNSYGEKSFGFKIVDSTSNYTRKGTEGKIMECLKTYDKKYGYNYKDPYFIRNGKYPTKNLPADYLKTSVDEILKSD